MCYPIRKGADIGMKKLKWSRSLQAVLKSVTVRNVKTSSLMHVNEIQDQLEFENLTYVVLQEDAPCLLRRIFYKFYSLVPARYEEQSRGLVYCVASFCRVRYPCWALRGLCKTISPKILSKIYLINYYSDIIKQHVIRLGRYTCKLVLRKKKP